ncbi:MAG: MBL fold metallo-hydrolase [Oscillospiraceae bacterium]|nr:MBL fold metallo-hydrolase [Oscillospiraceae bacterium]
MKFCTLSSGSSGNSAYLEHGGTSLLIDCGLSGRHIESCIESIGARPDAINYILITHEHIDHIRGAGVFSRKYGVPIYASSKTWDWILKRDAIGAIAPSNIRTFETGEEIYLDNIRAKAFKTPHDAVDSHGFRFECDGKIAVIATDVGHITEEIEEHILTCDVAIFEANHDEKMLIDGEYPEYLKARILSDYGHLPNRISAQIASKMIENGTKHLILSHLSKENNTPDKVKKEMLKVITKIGAKEGADFTYQIAPRMEPCEVVAV